MKNLVLVMFVLTFALTVTGQTRTKGVLLEDLTWVEAEKILNSDTVVVIPLGAAAKEHGPHLKLKNDWLIAEYLKKQVLAQSNVVVAPTINYHFYPAFVEYPGSTTLRLETARDLIVDICKSFAAGHADLLFSWSELGLAPAAPFSLLNPLTAFPGP